MSYLQTVFIDHTKCYLVGYPQDGKYLENFEDFEVRGSPVFTQIFQVKTQIFQVVPQKFFWLIFF